MPPRLSSAMAGSESWDRAPAATPTTSSGAVSVWVGHQPLRQRGDLRSHPRPGILGRLRCVLHDQVRGSGVPLDIRVGQPALQVAERRLREDRVPRPPQQQRRNARELSQSGGDVIERGAAGMAWLQGDIGDEIADRPPSISGGVRGPQRIAHLNRYRRPGQRRGGAYERRRTYAHQLPKHAAAHQPDQRRRFCRRRHGDPGVGQDQPGDLITVALVPSRAR